MIDSKGPKNALKSVETTECRCCSVSVPFDHTVGQLVGLVRGKAKVLQGSSGMRLGFQSFLTYAATSRTLMSFPCPFLSISSIKQADKYGGASDATLQQLRYLREGVFLRTSTPEQAAREALKRRSALESGSAEDLAALQNFAQDMRSGAVH